MIGIVRIVCLALITVTCCASELLAQRARIPPLGDPNALVPVPSIGSGGAPVGGSVGGSVGGPSGVTLGNPVFDPYSAGGPPAGLPPANPYFGPSYGQPTWGQPPGGAAGFGGQPAAAGTYGAAAPPWRSTPYGMGTGNPNPYPSQGPSSLFPDGFDVWGNGTGGSGIESLRLFENLRGRETFLAGSEGREMSIHDIEASTTVQFPNFLSTGNALHISPGFAIHLWDGPQPPSNADMPGAAYSALVEGAYRTDAGKPFGGDVSVSVGVYSDFNAITTESIRIQSYAFGWVRITPTLLLKGGINYIDRVDLALLPIIGLQWEPSPQVRLDITFPRPKLARSLGTIGNTEYWIYLAGEYGGGSWTIERTNGASDQVDINDIRLALGLDFTCQAGLRGNFEVGWVTQRRLVYRHFPADEESLSDTYMLRLGLSY